MFKWDVKHPPPKKNLKIKKNKQTKKTKTKTKTNKTKQIKKNYQQSN
jgi:hypothetical protein